MVHHHKFIVFCEQTVKKTHGAAHFPDFFGIWDLKLKLSTRRINRHILWWLGCPIASKTHSMQWFHETTLRRWARIPRERGWIEVVTLQPANSQRIVAHNVMHSPPKIAAVHAIRCLPKFATSKKKQGFLEREVFHRIKFAYRLKDVNFPPRSIERWNSDLCGSRL